jgi:hypothetical protein
MIDRLLNYLERRSVRRITQVAMTPEERREYKAMPRGDRANLDRYQWAEYKKDRELFLMGKAADARINAIGAETAMREADDALHAAFKPKPTARH